MAWVCQTGPYSPPPRILASTYVPPRESHSLPSTPSYPGVRATSKPP
ncbi:Uncharacterised protein [Mycobacteroides abscessus subsp. abscessus]|nr:Uncharacterised protein [Mycobacteroides abscessus subsp. abscessus]